MGIPNLFAPLCKCGHGKGKHGHDNHNGNCHECECVVYRPVGSKLSKIEPPMALGG